MIREEIENWLAGQLFNWYNHVDTKPPNTEFGDEFETFKKTFLPKAREILLGLADRGGVIKINDAESPFGFRLEPLIKEEAIQIGCH